MTKSSVFGSAGQRIGKTKNSLLANKIYLVCYDYIDEPRNHSASCLSWGILDIYANPAISIPWSR